MHPLPLPTCAPKSLPPISLIYFSAPDCGICTTVWPKLQRLLRTEFPELVAYGVNIAENGAISAQYGVFTAPTVLILFEGRESFRYCHSFSIGQLARDLARPYALYLHPNAR